MTKIKHVNVYGLDESITASGYPHTVNEPLFSETRSERLASAPHGSGHDNFLKGIICQFDILYPQYLSMQMQRYHWFDIVSSQSKMHCLTKGRFGYNKYVSCESAEQMHRLIKEYNNNPSYEGFMLCMSNCPMGLELWMRVSTNYLQLKTIYLQRKNHKLKEDWGAVCDMIENLPYSFFITGGND